MIKITKYDGWSANLKKIDFSIFKNDKISVRPEVAQRATSILQKRDKRHKYNFGMSLLSEDVEDINIYISAIMKVRSTKRQARFYVSCDKEEIVQELVEATTIKEEKFGPVCPIIPNYTGDDFSDEEKFIIDFFCLKEMYNVFTTPFNDYAYKTASIGKMGAYVPDEEDIYKIDWLDLMKI